jgi:hypothetical protein
MLMKGISGEEALALITNPKLVFTFGFPLPHLRI